VVDINGDTRADIVVTSACGDATVGTAEYLVYLNNGTGFDAAAAYALPSLPTAPGCVQTALVDVDGDSMLDFVVTSSCDDATIGSSHWLVYHNTGSAFDLTAISYTLPNDTGVRAFASLKADTALESLHFAPRFSIRARRPTRGR
jgi:hypothetical protein